MSDEELNAAVAEKVMGWTLSERLGYGWPIPHCVVPPCKYPRYSTDLRAAWTVIERLDELDSADMDRLELEHGGSVPCAIGPNRRNDFIAAIVEQEGGFNNAGDAMSWLFWDCLTEPPMTPCRAICLAAISAISHQSQGSDT